AEKKKQAALAEQARVAEQKKKAEEEARKIAAAKEAEEAKKAEAERKRIVEKQRVEAQRKAAADAKRKADKAAAQRRRAQAERALREQLASEQASLDSARQGLLDKGRAEYVARIRDKVNRRWIRPTGVRKGLRCKVVVEQIPSGDVIRVVIKQSSGNIAFDRSVEQAVLAASPLPRPKDAALFDREIIFTFDPED
ncbi:MAG: cell envelope integrity protein TolA, partial [Gammaproteobacteria bacterium]|nr:cell envelope integrity protein TolA [Gammaproteobacteria bacterium]